MPSHRRRERESRSLLLSFESQRSATGVVRSRGKRFETRAGPFVFPVPQRMKGGPFHRPRRIRVGSCRQIPYTRFRNYPGGQMYSIRSILEPVQGPGKGHRIMKVLIAEDSLLVSDRLKELIGELHEVEIIGPASDGDTALQLFREHEPEVVLLDLQMPGRGGLETLIEIRKQNRSCAVIILTNYDLPEFRAACRHAGADFFFRKFTEFERAVEIVSELVLRSLPPVNPPGTVAGELRTA